MAYQKVRGVGIDKKGRGVAICMPSGGRGVWVYLSEGGGGLKSIPMGGEWEVIIY